MAINIVFINMWISLTCFTCKRLEIVYTDIRYRGQSVSIYYQIIKINMQIDREEAKQYLGAMARIKAQRRQARLSNIKEALAGLMLFALGYVFVVLYLLTFNAQ